MYLFHFPVLQGGWILVKSKNRTLKARYDHNHIYLLNLDQTPMVEDPLTKRGLIFVVTSVQRNNEWGRTSVYKSRCGKVRLPHQGPAQSSNPVFPSGNQVCKRKTLGLGTRDRWDGSLNRVSKFKDGRCTRVHSGSKK